MAFIQARFEPVDSSATDLGSDTHDVANDVEYGDFLWNGFHEVAP